jgi:hypothetical protein
VPIPASYWLRVDNEKNVFHRSVKRIFTGAQAFDAASSSGDRATGDFEVYMTTNGEAA